MKAESPITNRWGEVPLRPVAAEHFPVYWGVAGSAYNHHPQITSLDGRLYATWSNGFRDEDTPGQRMLLATSDDRGETWSEPRPLVDRQPGRHGYGVVTAEGIHVYDGMMVAYYGYYDYKQTLLDIHEDFGPPNEWRGPTLDGPVEREQYRRNHHAGIMVSEDAGRTWQGPVAEIPDFVPNLAPHSLADGRLIMPGNMCFPYTDDPLGVEGWTMSCIPGLPDDYIDAPQEFSRGQVFRGDPYHTCEGSCYQTDDGVVHMMLRTSEHRLAVVESRDRGETWSEPVLTGYTDCACRFHFGRLPGGRYFGLSCPDPEGVRTPMVLATSEDGLVFDRHYLLGGEPWTPARIPGYWKYGRYSYPSHHILDGTIYAVYAPNKEDIAVCRVPLAALCKTAGVS